MAGEVYWSDRAGRFYQQGRRGAVSRDNAAKSLTYDAETKQFIDERGRTVPGEALQARDRSTKQWVGLDAQDRPVLKTETTYIKVTEQQAAKGTIKPGQDVVVRTIVTTPDGKVHITEVTGADGRNVDPGTIKDIASKKARADLIDKGYDLSTNQVKNSTVQQDFIRRSKNVKRL